MWQSQNSEFTWILSNIAGIYGTETFNHFFFFFLLFILFKIHLKNLDLTKNSLYKKKTFIFNRAC